MDKRMTLRELVKLGWVIRRGTNGFWHGYHSQRCCCTHNEAGGMARRQDVVDGINAAIYTQGYPDTWLQDMGYLPV